jgi:hypothetical protein
MRNSQEDSEDFLALKRAVTAFKDAETLFFDGRKLHTAAPALIQDAYRQSNLSLPVTRQKYYSWNHAETNFVHVESTVGFDGKDLTTLFIKNREGIWDVYQTLVCEVSAIFKHDELMGMFPFFRFFSALEYPYELSVDTSHSSEEHLVIKGHLSAKPPQCQEDIASEFSYTISKGTGHLCSLYEKTFKSKSCELVLDTVEINGPVDESLFQLPDKQKITVSNLPDYMNVRMKEWGRTMLAG